MATAEPTIAGATGVIISVNPSAGFQNRQAIVTDLMRRLADFGLRVQILHEIDAVAQAVRELQAAGELRAVIAAGGDGTVRLVAEHTPPGTPLAVFPLGTENLLARYLELTADPAQLAHIISAGVTVSLDAGTANGRLFSLVAGCGFDADVVSRLHRSRRGHIHHLSYAKPILDAIRNYRYPELRVRYAPANATADAELSEEVAARWVFVVNVPRYAGGLSFAPQATGTDGLLDLCTFKSGSLWHGLLYLGGVMFGQHQGMRDFTRIQTGRLRVEAAAQAPYQLDGDPGGNLPVEISVAPQRLTLLVARGWAERNGIGDNRTLKEAFRDDSSDQQPGNSRALCVWARSAAAPDCGAVRDRERGANAGDRAAVDRNR